MLSNRLEKEKERLEGARESIKALCEPVEPPKDTMAYIRYFCAKNTENSEELKGNEPKRLALYKYTVALIRAYANLANEMVEAGYSAPEIEEIKREVKYYRDVREEMKRASGDYIDLKAYEPAMRHLIDTYIRAEESEKISAFDDLSLIELIVERGEDAIKELPKGIRKDPEAVAETIENNVRRLIIDEMPTNPKYYEDMSVLLDEIIKARKEAAKHYEEYLAKIVELSKKVKNPGNSANYPESLNSNAKRALYDNLGHDEELALALHASILRNRYDGWRGSMIKERKVMIVIKEHIKDKDKAEEIFEIVKNKGTTNMHQITVGNIEIDVVKKDIKNLHLGVYPPNGRVRIAAPLKVNDDAVRLFAITK
ncbi:hypothetical protein [Risungbinella massiliensis]|uniref:hypothetical protein n=1 Tax=Risungbinella massiliensis TaxID=1329796 RepID=UPI000A87A77D|nr:hypothetical protein [Risungbinella massiliensis]